MGGDKKGGAGNKKGGGGPSSTMQHANLVSKLDVLTSQSLHVELTAEQKKKAKELLADLAEKDPITDDDAAALLDLLEPNKKTLEEAGYRAPGGGGGMGGGGGGGGGGGQPPPNPFKTGDAADRLKSLQATLGK